MSNNIFFQSIVNLVSDIIWEVDENRLYTYISGKVEEYTGYTADELIGKTPFSLMSDDEAEKLKNIFNKTSSGRENITDVEVCLFNKKNELRYFIINGIPVIDDRNRLKGYRGIVRNITDKKSAEIALKESENHLSKLMNSLPVMAYRGLFKDDFNMEFVSDGAYPLTGHLPSDFMKNSLLAESIIHPDDINIVYTYALNALNDKKQFEVLHRIITADSKIKWVMGKGFGIYKDEKLSGIEGFAFDITETNEAIEYGKINERRFQNLFESNPQGVALADRDGYIVQVNKTWKKMFGYSGHDMHKLHMCDIRMEQNRESDFSLLKSLVNKENESYRIERPFIKKDGSVIWCDLTVALIEDPEEKELYALALYVDITERKKIEEELEKFHEELESLVAERTEEINKLTQKVINSQEEERQRIARDLHDGVGQTILASKYAFNSFINGNNKDNKLLERGKTLIDIASQELREIYTGIYPSMLDELGLNDTIKWFVRNFLETSGLKVNYNNNFKNELSHNLTLNIYRIIQELFNNIVKHSKADTVNVSLYQEGELIIIEVSDNGKGFDIENIKKTSTGAGLINVRQRVDYLKGHPEIDSKPGRTWIKIKIPLEQK